MARHDPELSKAFEVNRAAIDAECDHDRRTCPCGNCVDQRWHDARHDEFDARWNAAVNP